MNSVQFKGWITFDDALRVEKLLAPRKLWSASGLVIIALMATIAVNVIAMQTSWLFTILFLAGAGIFFGGLLWLLHRYSLNSKRIHYANQSIERAGTLAQDIITVFTDKTKSEMQWDLFDKVIETDGLVMAAKGMDYVAFAPYMFATPQDWNACKEIVRKIKPQQAVPGYPPQGVGSPEP